MKTLKNCWDMWTAFLGLKNPHQVTLAQTNVFSKAEVDALTLPKVKGRYLPILYFCRNGSFPTITVNASGFVIPATGTATYNGTDGNVKTLTVNTTAAIGIYLIVRKDYTFEYSVAAPTSNYLNWIKVGNYDPATKVMTWVQACKVGTTVIKGA